MKRTQSLLALMVGCLLACPAQSQQPAPSGQEATQAVDNGTDPTKFSKVAEAKYEYLDLRDGFSSQTLRLSYTHPLGEKRNYSLRFRALATSVDVLGNGNFGIGDVSVQLAHVFGLTKEHGFVAQGELLFNTAQRPELGSGKNAFKGTLIYARFLKDGSIFAPAFVQNNSFSVRRCPQPDDLRSGAQLRLGKRQALLQLAGHRGPCGRQGVRWQCHRFHQAVGLCRP
jgi:hypothetical protein